MSADGVRRFVIAYDVADDLRRTRIAKVLESFGDRVQYSVFLVDAKPSRLMRLQAAVVAHLDLTSDSLLVCDVGPLAVRAAGRIAFIGRERGYTGHGPLVF